MEYKINFKCPHCGGNQLLSREVNVRQWFNAVTLTDNGHEDPEVDDIYIDSDAEGAVETEDGNVEGYECGECNEDIALTRVDLFNFLKNNNMLEEIKE